MSPSQTRKLLLWIAAVLLIAGTSLGSNVQGVDEPLQPQINSGRGGLKWSQAPQRFDATTPFIFNGWSERSDPNLHRILADDWLQDDDRPVTGFQWWGSFAGWTQSMLPPERPRAFQIAIWTNAAGQGHPDRIVWQKSCVNWTWNLAGYNNDPRGLASDTCFQFTCPLSQDQWFHPNLAKDANSVPAPTVYWLSITALYDANASLPAHPWGWATRPQFFNNGAVQISVVAHTEPTSTRWLAGSTIDSPEGIAWDLAFELLTNQGSLANDPELAPVYRLSCDKLDMPFYTISETEKDALLRNTAQGWTLDGIAFYAYPPERAPVGSKPVYRFWSESLGRHRFTISEAERRELIEQSSPAWTQEGIAWYAFD